MAVEVHLPWSLDTDFITTLHFPTDDDRYSRPRLRTRRAISKAVARGELVRVGARIDVEKLNRK
jgi:hypothetical protein